MGSIDTTEGSLEHDTIRLLPCAKPVELAAHGLTRPPARPLICTGRRE